MTEGTVKWFNSDRALALSLLMAARRMCSFTIPRSKAVVFARLTRISESSSTSARDLMALRQSE